MQEPDTCRRTRRNPSSLRKPVKGATHLCLKGSIYYFRYVLPALARKRFGHSEVKLSLKTGFLYEARYRSRKVMAMLEGILEDSNLSDWEVAKAALAEELEKAMRGVTKKNPIGIDEIRQRMDDLLKKVIDEKDTNFSKLDCCKLLVGDDFVSPTSETGLRQLRKLDQISRDNALLQHEALYPLLIWQLLGNNVVSLEELTPENIPVIINEYYRKLQITYRRIMEERNDGNFAFERQFIQSNNVSNICQDKKQSSTNELILSEFIDKYICTKLSDGQWTERNIPTHKDRIGNLLDILGDIPVTSIDRNAMRKFRDILESLPPNRSRSKKYKGKTIEELLNMNIEKTLNIKTVNIILESISGMFEWGIREGLIDKNPAKDLTRKDERLAIDLRNAFTDEDIDAIFFSGNYTPDKFINPAYYWVPLIGLYTGMRLEEICQLHTEDIYEEDGVWLIDIRSDSTDGLDDKILKNRNAARRIPIHKDLLDLGFLEYHNKMAESSIRLFPKLNKTEKSPKYGKQVGKQFATLLKSRGIEGKKSFHSLRHTFSDYFKKLNLHNDIFRQVFGHEADKLAARQYGSKFSVKQCYDELISRIVWEKA